MLKDSTTQEERGVRMSKKRYEIVSYDIPLWLKPVLSVTERPDGTYQFRWTDENRKRHCIYARNLDDLRYKEDEIDKDKKDGIKAEARYTSLNDMYELWRDLKRGIKNNTFENYK